MASYDTTERKKTSKAVWFLVLALAEIAGTGLLLFMGCSGNVLYISGSKPTGLQMNIVFGITVAIVVQIFGHISGAHINPAVTVAATVYKIITVPTAILYIISQIIGAILGYGFLLVITPTEALYEIGSPGNVTHRLCTTAPNPIISTMQALVAEFIATTILLLLCCTVWNRKSGIQPDGLPIKFGLTVTGLAIALGPYSGASMNPARSLAPAIFTGVWEKHWIYWLGPLSAAIFTSCFYKFTFERNQISATVDQLEIPLKNSTFKVQNMEISPSEVSNM